MNASQRHKPVAVDSCAARTPATALQVGTLVALEELLAEFVEHTPPCNCEFLTIAGRVYVRVGENQGGRG